MNIDYTRLEWHMARCEHAIVQKKIDDLQALPERNIPEFMKLTRQLIELEHEIIGYENKMLEEIDKQILEDLK